MSFNTIIHLTPRKFNILRHFLHTSTSANNLSKQGKMISKMLHPKTKRKWVDNYENTLPTIKSLAKKRMEPGKNGLRRVAVLNKLFMKNITDLMSTGSVAMEILGRGIEISKVNITPDFHLLNVYWVCGADAEGEAETEALLNRVAGALRHELSQLRLMGEVPTIMFVKDTHMAQVVELDRRLARADYGEDYTPTDLGHLLKSELTLDTKLSPDMKAKIKHLEDTESDNTEECVPEMTHSVYGLEHERILNRLLAMRKTSMDAWNRAELGTVPDVVSYRPGDPQQIPVDYLNQQKQNLADFLEKRQLLHNRIHKELRSSHAERSVAFELQDAEDLDDYYSDDDVEEELADDEVNDSLEENVKGKS